MHAMSQQSTQSVHVLYCASSLLHKVQDTEDNRRVVQDEQAMPMALVIVQQTEVRCITVLNSGRAHSVRIITGD